jgi:hypothetical protein
MKVVREEAGTAGTIDYRMNILGIRVTKCTAQLVARWHENDWTTIGPHRELPVRIPLTQSELKSAAQSQPSFGARYGAFLADRSTGP